MRGPSWASGRGRARRIGLLAVLAVSAAVASACTSTTSGTAPPVVSQFSPTATTPASSPAAPTTPATSASRRATPTTHPRTPGRSTPAPVNLPAVSFPPGTGPVVVLNPGHNGGNAAHASEIARQVPAGFGAYKACDTTGTETNAGYAEHAFNWDVSLRVRAILQQHGVRVVLTRPNDTGVGPCVDQRAAIGNEPGVAAVVSIHADGAPSGDHGFHVCYDSRPPDGPTVEAQSIRLSTAIHDALLNQSGLVPAAYIGNGQGYYPRSDLAGLNLAMEPATFLEIGNMRNAGDAAAQSSAAGRARIAAAIASGILSYLGR